MSTNKEMKNLGWANGWTEAPEIVKKCKEAGHQPKHEERGPRNRGLENVVTCEECGYIYRYDSSD